jgi:hypothetical protein
VLHWRKLPPPSGATVYELTPRGRELESVVVALARWGSQALPLPRGELSIDALMLALETTFDPQAAGNLGARIELRVDDEPYCAAIARKKLEISRGPCAEPDVVITTDGASLRQVAFGLRELGPARRAGDLELAGDEALGARFFTLFRRPTTRR